MGRANRLRPIAAIHIYLGCGLLALVAPGCKKQDQEEGENADTGTQSSSETLENTSLPDSTGEPSTGAPTPSNSAPQDSASAGDSTATLSTSASSSTQSTSDTSTSPGSPVGPELPKVTGTCPTFKDGVLRFKPDKLKKERRVLVYAPKTGADAKPGPMVFFWHGMGAHPTQAKRAMGQTLQRLHAQNGWLIAPYADPKALPLPWFSFNSDKQDDHLLADEIVACAMQQGVLDPRRIHMLGMSAGAFQAGSMSFVRSNYVASTAMYSGGFLEERKIPERSKPGMSVASMLLFGGEIDRILHVKYRRTSKRYLDQLSVSKDRGLQCNHRRGHSMPSSAHAGVWKFFEDHPFLVRPKSYADKLPKELPDYCEMKVDKP